MYLHYRIVAAVLPAVFLAACASSGSGGSGGVVIIDQPVYADDNTTLDDVPDGTEFPLLQAYAALDADGNLGNAEINAEGNVGNAEINDDDASLTPVADGVHLKVASLNREVTFDENNATVENGAVHFDQPISNGSAHLSLFGETANLIYSQFGMWAFNWNDGAVDVAFWAGGLQTRPENVPTAGTATYNGRVIGGATDGQDIFDLLGDVAMTADFATGNVNGGFSNMMATNVDDDSSNAWNDVTFSASIANGTNTFAGTPSVTAANNNPGGLDAGATGTLTGQFFGPQAEEAGGAWVLSDDAVTAIGSFGATQ